MRFAEKLTNEEIRKRILKLMETGEFLELEGLLAELKFRRRDFRRRIILEMSEFKDILGVIEK